MEKGSYLLHLFLKKTIRIDAGSLQGVVLPRGKYIYVGSARGGIEGRVARHQRLAQNKTGKLHWHIDYLLIHPHLKFIGFETLAGKDECTVSQQLASKNKIRAPAPGFGSTDCRRGCKSHLYFIDE
jgi:Uri superfamily endonuclease